MIARPPLRFLGLVVGAWIVGRVAWLLPPPPPGLPAPAGLLLPPMPAAAAADRATVAVRSARLAASPGLPSRPMRREVRESPESRSMPVSTPLRRDLADDGSGRFASELLLYAAAIGRPSFARAPRGAADPAAAPPPAGRRLAGYAYLYLRPGGARGAALGPGGQLGASQAGARAAYRVGRGVSVAARVSLPTDDPAASEAAAGLDLAIAKGARVSVERRVALGKRGRDAWSAYAAAGFYEGLGRGLVLDGYGQAGVVGARRRDLFADGALRGGRRLSLDAERALVLGAGAWGAAQPGVARLDVGPRAALAMPLGDVATTLALEGRMRVAGKARPGSGVALTLAADF